MKAITVKHGQSLADIAIQERGGLDGLPELAATNGLAPSDEPEAGQVLHLRETAPTPLTKFLSTTTIATWPEA